MAQILSVIVGALLTAVLGNALVQRWQLRGWRAQQVHLGLQSELEELKRLVEELTSSASNRMYAMRRLSGATAPGSTVSLEGQLENYRTELAKWNTSLNSYLVRLNIYLNYGMSIRFESEIHTGFRVSGEMLEQVVRSRLAGEPRQWTDVSLVNAELTRVQGRLVQFSRDLLKRLEERKHSVYYGKRILYKTGDLREYTRLELVKALLTSDVNGFYVVRPS